MLVTDDNELFLWNKSNNFQIEPNEYQYQNWIFEQSKQKYGSLSKHEKSV